jgi:hypothetical protein
VARRCGGLQPAGSADGGGEWLPQLMNRRGGAVEGGLPAVPLPAAVAGARAGARAVLVH